MTATTIRQVEATPDTWPDAGELLLSDAALKPEKAAIWGRIDAWIAHRCSPRSVVWTVEGPGDWTPPLAPVEVNTVEVWQDETWVLTEPALSPLGYSLPGGTYRITAIVGADNPVPRDVAEAFRRLAEYFGQNPGKAGATSERASAGSVSFSVRRSASWLAQAMANSGAGDLLRPYRRA